MTDMYRLGVFDLDHSFTHHFCALKNTAACPNQSLPKERKALRAGSATSYLQSSYYHTSVAIPLPLSSAPCLLLLHHTPHNSQTTTSLFQRLPWISHT